MCDCKPLREPLCVFSDGQRGHEDAVRSHPEERRTTAQGCGGVEWVSGRQVPSGEHSSRHSVPSGNGAPLVPFWGWGGKFSAQSRRLPGLLEEQTQAESSDAELGRGTERLDSDAKRAEEGRDCPPPHPAQTPGPANSPRHAAAPQALGLAAGGTLLALHGPGFG